MHERPLSKFVCDARTTQHVQIIISYLASALTVNVTREVKRGTSIESPGDTDTANNMFSKYTNYASTMGQPTRHL